MFPVSSVKILQVRIMKPLKDTKNQNLIQVIWGAGESFILQLNSFERRCRSL